MSKNCRFLKILYSVLQRLFKMSEVKKNKINHYCFKPFVIEKIHPDNKTILPQPRSGHRVVCDSKNLYSFGGYNPHIQNEDGTADEIWVESYPLFQELWRYNFASRTWTRYYNRRSLPKELASNAVIRKGNTLMVFSCVRFLVLRLG